MLTKVIFTAAIATSAQASIFDGLDKIAKHPIDHVEDLGIDGVIRHGEMVASSLPKPHIKPAIAHDRKKPT